MNINEILLNGAIPYLANYNCSGRRLGNFMLNEGDFSQRQQEAVSIIKSIMSSNDKELLYEYVAKLADIEPRIRNLQPWARDHVVHALLSFVLGINLNERFLPPDPYKVDPFQWKIAGLFHDIWYPLQIAAEGLVKPFSEQINQIKKELGSDKCDIKFQIVPEGLNDLNNGVNSIELVQERLNDWNLEVNAQKIYDDMLNSGNIKHGVISSLAVLYIIDLMYQKYNPKRLYIDVPSPNNSANFNQKYFREDVVSACSAIYIHDLPKTYFSKKKLDHTKAPVGFLLKLCDALQEWERPSLRNQKGYSAANFEIIIDTEKLTFEADIPNERKAKIKNELSSLDLTGIEIAIQ